MSLDQPTCTVCSRSFELRFSFQQQRTEHGAVEFCSQACHEQYLLAGQQKSCSVCSQPFEQQFAYQQATVDKELRYFCSLVCRDRQLSQVQPTPRRNCRIAVLNQKGGTGKTTTSVNLAAGLADAGFRTLLIDLDAQGNVAVSLGLRSKYTLYNILVEDAHPADCIVNVATNLDALISSTSLAQAEIFLVNQPDRHKILRRRLKPITNYDFVVMDCGPSLSVLNQNALAYAEHIVIPVSCDYLSLVGVKQILRTLKRVNRLLLEPVNILGVVPTFYDKRTRASQEAVETLKAYFKERVMSPIRVNTRLKEAPSHKQSIFEYAPDCHGARDYRDMVNRVVELCTHPVPHQGKEPAIEQSGA